mmetsp:Transcript_69696/g.203983  ORF Transcript_69696/g.203983 Transcript_69696/m.203983 type:complete len:202 (-) Transcript_69696:276-881(-)
MGNPRLGRLELVRAAPHAVAPPQAANSPEDPGRGGGHHGHAAAAARGHAGPHLVEGRCPVAGLRGLTFPAGAVLRRWHGPQHLHEPRVHQGHPHADCGDAKPLPHVGGLTDLRRYEQGRRSRVDAVLDHRHESAAGMLTSSRKSIHSQQTTDPADNPSRNDPGKPLKPRWVPKAGRQAPGSGQLDRRQDSSAQQKEQGGEG